MTCASMSAQAICRRALDRQGDGWLSTADTHAVLAAFGFPLIAGAIARTADEAAAHAARFGFPVAAKLASRRVIHKSDIGAVRLNLKTAEEVRIAFQEIWACAPEPAPSDDPEHDDGILIQPMATDAVETIVGATADPLFGPLVGFGLGGTQVELFGDMRFRVAPLTDRDADELLHEGRGARAAARLSRAALPPISTRSRRLCCEPPVSPKRCRRSASSISIR